MRILIAEDDPTSKRLLEATLARWGHEVVSTSDGEQALRHLLGPDSPRLAILDWMMPELDGVEVCRRVRAGGGTYTYVILLTAKGRKEDVVEGLETGADDYVTKPFNPSELRSRIQAGERIIALEEALSLKIHELKDVLAHVKQLEGLLPICMHCKRIRDEGRNWQKMEAYISDRSEARFSHALCDDCMRTHYPDVVASMGK